MGTRSRTAARSSDAGRPPRPGRAFFDRPAARVATDLLGARLAVCARGRWVTARLVETEAYERGDPASHAFRGPTRRNRSMFGAPGTLYVFRIHQVVCANLVARRGEAVLLRAGAVPELAARAASGPGRLCRALGLTIDDDGEDAVAGLRVRVRAAAARPPRIRAGRRIGIRRAVARRLRFWIDGEPAVSRPRGLSASASPSRSRGGGRSRRSRRTSRPSSGDGRSGARTAGR